MSTTYGTAFFSIYIRLTAMSRLKTISDGGSKTRKRCGGAQNVWQVSHALVICSNSCRVALSTWFDRARFIASYNFPDVGCLKWRYSLIISDFVNKIDFKFNVRSRCPCLRVRGIDQPRCVACSLFWTLFATSCSLSKTSRASSNGTSAGTTFTLIFKNEWFGVGILICMVPSDENTTSPNSNLVSGDFSVCRMLCCLQ